MHPLEKIMISSYKFNSQKMSLDISDSKAEILFISLHSLNIFPRTIFLSDSISSEGQTVNAKPPQKIHNYD